MAADVGHVRRQMALAHLAGVTGVERAYLASSDGLLLGAIGGNSADDEVVSGVIAALCGATRRVLAALELGESRECVLTTDSHAVYCLGRDDILLVAIAARGASAGAVRLELRRAARILAAT